MYNIYIYCIIYIYTHRIIYIYILYNIYIHCIMYMYKHTKYVVRLKSTIPMIEFVLVPFVQALPSIVHAQDEAVSGLES